MSFYTDLVNIFDNVKTQIELAPVTALQGYVDGGMSWPLTANGSIKPCAVIELPGLGSGPRSFNAITGAKDSLARARFDVLCVGPTAKSCVQVVGLVTDQLVGYKPGSGTSEIGLLGSVMLAPAMQTGAPTRFAMPVGFSLSVNAIVV